MYSIQLVRKLQKLFYQCVFNDWEGDSNSEKLNFFHFGLEPEAEKRPRALQGEDPAPPIWQITKTDGFPEITRNSQKYPPET